MFVATKVLLQQNTCFVATNVFVATNTCLSQHKLYLWQLLPMVLNASNVTSDAKLPHCRSEADVFYLKVQL